MCQHPRAVGAPSPAGRAESRRDRQAHAPPAGRARSARRGPFPYAVTLYLPIECCCTRT